MKPMLKRQGNKVGSVLLSQLDAPDETLPKSDAFLYMHLYKPTENVWQRETHSGNNLDWTNLLSVTFDFCHGVWQTLVQLAQE